MLLANVSGTADAITELSGWSRTPPEVHPFGNEQRLVRVSLNGSDIDTVLAGPLVIGISYVPKIELSDEPNDEKPEPRVCSSTAPISTMASMIWTT